MALIIPSGFVQFVFVLDFETDDEAMVTTIGAAVGGTADQQGSVNHAHSAFGAEIMPSLCEQMTLLETVGYFGNGEGAAPDVVVSTSASLPGANGTNVLPPNCALLFRKRTDTAGRRGRGRMYVPGVSANSVNDNGTIPDATVQAINIQLDQFMEAMVNPGLGGDTLSPVVLHRSEGAGAEPAPSPITSLRCENKIATQRRRLRP